MTARRFPPPWTVEEYRGIFYIVRDANNFPVAYVYFDLVTKDEARKIAGGIAKLPELLGRRRVHHNVSRGRQHAYTAISLAETPALNQIRNQKDKAPYARLARILVLGKALAATQNAKGPAPS